MKMIYVYFPPLLATFKGLARLDNVLHCGLQNMQQFSLDDIPHHILNDLDSFCFASGLTRYVFST